MPTGSEVIGIRLTTVPTPAVALNTISSQDGARFVMNRKAPVGSNAIPSTYPMLSTDVNVANGVASSVRGLRFHSVHVVREVNPGLQPAPAYTMLAAAGLLRAVTGSTAIPSALPGGPISLDAPVDRSICATPFPE